MLRGKNTPLFSDVYGFWGIVKHNSYLCSSTDRLFFLWLLLKFIFIFDFLQFDVWVFFVCLFVCFCFFDTIKWFSNSQQTVTGCPTNITQFWHCLPGECITAPRLKVQSYTTESTSNASHRSQVATCPSDLLATKFKSDSQFYTLLKLDRMAMWTWNNFPCPI